MFLTEKYTIQTTSWSNENAGKSPIWTVEKGYAWAFVGHTLRWQVVRPSIRATP